MRARDGWEYVDSRAKVAREIEIRRVTENLDAIKCMGWSMTVALIFVMRAEGVSVTTVAWRMRESAHCARKYSYRACIFAPNLPYMPIIYL